MASRYAASRGLGAGQGRTPCVLGMVALVLSACTAKIEPSDVTVKTAPVKVTVGGSEFCPPGQAKKGNC